jgi:molybdate transport system substrate-binding protein
MLSSPQKPGLHIRRRVLALGVLGVATALPAFGQARTLTVATDSSLLKAMSEVARGFEATRPGLRVVLVAGEPGAMLAQIANPEAATRFDVLAGTDAETAALGMQRRLLRPEVRSAFAGNALVLVAPPAGGISTVRVERLADLARPEVLRIAIGRINDLPVGRYAREAINAQRLWPSVQRKLVQADSGAKVLELVQQGDVDAGFVYASDAAAAGASVRTVVTLPTVTPIRYGALVVAASPQAALAAEFLEHLRSETTRAVWQRAGLALP